MITLHSLYLVYFGPIIELAGQPTTKAGHKHRIIIHSSVKAPNGTVLLANRNMNPYNAVAVIAGSVCVLLLLLGDNDVSAASTASSTNTGNNKKRRLAGYEPLTPILNYANLDLDMQNIEQMVEFGLLDLARAMYQHGGHSRSVSNLTLVNFPTPPSIPIPSGSKVIGQNIEGTMIQAILLEPITPWPEGTERVSISVEYDNTHDNQTSFCRLGGLAMAGTADIDGCFSDSAGSSSSIQILDFISQGSPVYHFDFSYDPYVNTYNLATFQKLSTMLELKMQHTNNDNRNDVDHSSLNGGHDGTTHHKINNGDNTSSSNSSTINSQNGRTNGPNTKRNNDATAAAEQQEQQQAAATIESEHYNKYTSYYKTPYYADEFIQAALNAHPTNFLHGNAYFETYRPRSRVEVLRVATKTLHVWMYVIQQLESAIDLCSSTELCVIGEQHHDEGYGTRCDDLPVREWDQSFAYYAGSLEGELSEGRGNMLFEFANNMCLKTNTCDPSTGFAKVNHKLVELYTKGQLTLLRRHCDEANDIKEQIVRSMTVPLVQAVLHESYFDHVQLSATQDIEEVQRASYAAALLPLVHHCNPSDAETIYYNLGLGFFPEAAISTINSGEDIDEITPTHKEINFGAIKQALESNYGCLGVTCREVGGVWDGTEYGPNASPCTFDDEGSTKSKLPKDQQQFIITVVLVVTVCVLLLLLVGVLLVRRHLSSSSFVTRRGYQKDPDDNDDDGIHRVDDDEENNHDGRQHQSSSGFPNNNSIGEADDWENQMTTVELD